MFIPLKIIFFFLILFLNPLYSKSNENKQKKIIKDTLHIYISPFGKDNNLGIKIDTPILTLKKAHDTLQKHLSTHPRNAIVHIASGIYIKQKVNWYFTMLNYTITLQGNKHIKPIFDGKGMGSSWFRMPYHPNANHSNIHIKSIQIQNYNNAIFFKGEKNDWSKDVSRNIVENCDFLNIGDKYSTSPVGYAAISLSNSRYNIFKTNTFKNIINNKTKCNKNNKCFSTEPLIHAFYLSYYSSKNIIKHNTFKSISGDAIKVRDFCNFNSIEYNTFNKTRRVFQDWYATYRNIKMEDHIECYSWGNTLQHNKIGINFKQTKNSPLVDIKTKYYTSSGQKDYCDSKVFRKYKINPNASSSNIYNQPRTFENNNTWNLSHLK